MLKTDAETIAVIGRGGSTKGKGWGDEIDTHDAVVRMHMQYPTFSNVVDLGSKWTYVASGLHQKAITHTAADTREIWCVHWEEKFGNRIGNVPVHFGGPVQFMPYNWAKECSDRLEHWPSSGCFLLFWLYKSDLLKRCTIYGIDGYRTGYYNGAEAKHPAHNMEKERPVLDWLFSMARDVK